MPKILDVLKELNIQCMATHRREVDIDTSDSAAGENDEPSEVPFESPPASQKVISVLPPSPNSEPSLFKYFLDGSRRVFSVSDIVVGNKYYPMVAGQVGVGVTERTDSGKIRPVKEHCSFKNLIAFPNVLPEGDIREIREAINLKSRIKFDICTYKVKAVPNLMDLGIAKIMTEMHDLEVKAVIDLEESGRLSDNEMLIVDGALQFAKQNFSPEKFRNVIGLSKSFRTNLSVGKGKKKHDIGTLVKRLGFGDRSHVFGAKFGKFTLGSWYLQIRDKSAMTGPIQGVVKIEAYAVGSDEVENGLDQSRVNNISKNILSERNVTPYGKDKRWAVHLYPIYLTESFIKSKFASSNVIMGAF